VANSDFVAAEAALGVQGSEICRLIVDHQPASGTWNMAVDEALLESAVGGGPCTLRWYRWEQATLSLGYFQTDSAARNDPRFGGLPVVRRLSGGGAIIHDHEWTYSCTLPARHELARDARQLYARVHNAVIRALGALGMVAEVRGTTDGSRGNEFLCFARRDDFDVVMGGQKVLGSAQRRRKGAVLQHGSLVLQASRWTREFSGVFDCAGRAVPEIHLVERLAAEVGIALAPQVERGGLSPAELRRATQLCQEP
jgi:lipoate-protein ligase A